MPSLEGFLFIISLSAGSVLRASAGKLSVIRFIHRIWSGRRGRGRCIRIDATIKRISSRFAASRNLVNFFVLSKIFLPCFTASTIVAKLSSSKTMSEASLATSVPL